MAASKWRLIPLLVTTGAEQMAIDRWLLAQHAQGLQPPSLRFYEWRSPTISLGYHQQQFPDHWKTLQYKGQSVDLVRRPTGGRAVLHQGDLTYALVTSGLQGSRRAVYHQLCQFLIEGWRCLGIDLSLGAAGRSYIKNPNCFGSATSADLVMSDGYKLIGSAQVYREGCVLQHGSMRLQADVDLFEAVFGEQTCSSDSLEYLLATYKTEDIVNALVTAARSTFEVDFDLQPLTSEERAQAIAGTADT
ncbi:MAG: biotin/lipoate A/B protein ligase family protein [Cyanobacteria bacterium J06623_4]